MPGLCRSRFTTRFIGASLHQDVKAIRASLLASAAARKLRCRRRAAAVGSQGSACKTLGARQRFPHASHRKPRNLFLRFRLHADHDERASRRESWTGGCSFVEKRHRSSARTAVSDDKYFVLVALPSARCGRAVEAYNSKTIGLACWRSAAVNCDLRETLIGIGSRGFGGSVWVYSLSNNMPTYLWGGRGRAEGRAAKTPVVLEAR